MRNNSFSVRVPVAPLLAAALAIFASGSTAFGGLALSTEVLIGDQAANVVFLVHFQGLDKPATVSYTHQIDAGDDFSLQSNPGGVYAGQPFANASTADFDPVADAYGFSSTGSLGGELWSTTGEALLDRRSDGSVRITYHYDYFDASNQRAAWLDFVSWVTPIGPGVFYPASSIGKGALTLPSGRTIEIDSWDSLAASGAWFNQTTPDDLDPYQCGYTDPVTGAGWSTVYFEPPPDCPEPSTLASLVAGLLVALRWKAAARIKATD